MKKVERNFCLTGGEIMELTHGTDTWTSGDKLDINDLSTNGDS